MVFTTLNKEGMPLIRFRTRDITSITHERCACGRTLAKMSRILARTDDMLIIRGVNVFPSQVEAVLCTLKEVEPHFFITVILVVADDPSMHSSQDEQDSRAYGRFAMLPLLEPATQQEAYDAVRFGLDLSEAVKLPVVLRLTTRMSHSRAVIERKAMRDQNAFNPDVNTRQWILLPAIAKKNYAGLIDKQTAIEKSSAESPFNKVVEGKGKKAVIAFGIGYNYVMEVCKTNNLELPVLKISQYPLPKDMVQSFIDKYDDILIVEEGYPIYEELLRGFSDNKKFRGRLDGALPRMGELSPDAVAPALGVKPVVGQPVPDIMVNRPPALCVGCSHRDLSSN